MFFYLLILIPFALQPLPPVAPATVDAVTGAVILPPAAPVVQQPQIQTAVRPGKQIFDILLILDLLVILELSVIFVLLMMILDILVILDHIRCLIF